MRMVVLSTTEGADKPFKYPAAFKTAQVVVLNKTDLLPYIDFDMALFTRGIAQVTPKAMMFSISCRTGEGIEELIDWIVTHRRNKPSNIDH